MVLVLLAGCDKDKDKFKATNVEYSGCVEKPKDLKTTVTYYQNTLSITHDYLPVDCNFEGVLITPSIDEENRVIEIDVDPIVVHPDLEGCECEINVSYDFENFYPKNAIYTIIIREINQEIYRGEEAL